MLYSRGVSTRQPHPVTINLDNLEELQDRWAKQVDPSKDLQKLSLMQHLLRLSGKLQFVEETVASLSQRLDLKTALQTAVLAFQHTTIGLGTSKEKLVAYMGYMNQEEVRGPRMEELRRVRFQMIKEEEEKHEGSHDGIAGATAAVKESPSHMLSRSQLPDRSTDRGMVVSALKVQNTRSDMLPCPSRGLVESSPGKTPSSALTTPLSHALTTYTGRSQSFCSSRTPYVPRDAKALNTNYFGNRTFRPWESVSNPSGAPLPYSVDGQPGLVGSHLRIGGGWLEEGGEGRAEEDKAPSAVVLRSSSGNRLTGGETGRAPASTATSRDEGSGGVAAPDAVSISDRSGDESRGNRMPSGTQGRNPIKETLDISLSSSFCYNSVKQGTIYLPVLDAREPHEPFVYYCANPAPLFT